MAALIAGGSSVAMADTVIVDGNSIADGWINGGAKSFTCSTGTISYAASAFLTTTSGQLSAANTYSWYSLASNSAIELAETQTIEIGVQAKNNYGGELIVSYSADGATFTNAVDVTNP